MSKMSEKTVNAKDDRAFFGHPKGLFTLFFTEFWERFSYYGMRAILLYYMYYEVTQGGLGLSKSVAMSIMSIYGSLVYMSGIIGGWLADRVFGTSKSVFYGGVLIMFGHIVLAIPGNLAMFFASMVLIVIGTGLLKPNVSSIVGDLYDINDNRRDAGFSIFYMGINLGGFISPLIAGALMTTSFHLGFSVAAVGMFLGLIVYVATRKKYLGTAGTQVPNPLKDDEKKRVYSIIAIGSIVIALFIALGAFFNFLTIDGFVAFIGILGFVIPTIYFVTMYRSPKTTEVEQSRLLAFIPLFIASVLFWVIAEQGSTVLAVYADERTNLSFMGITWSPAWFQSFWPLFVIFLAPAFAVLWTKLGDRQPNTTQKFALGLLAAGLSFVVILIPGYLGGTDALVNPLWLVLSIFFVAVGEMCLSPVGLSATTKLAPAAFSAQTMSLWFLSNAAAQALNAQLVKFYSEKTEIFYFGAIGGAAIMLAIVLFLIAPIIQKFMRGIK